MLPEFFLNWLMVQILSDELECKPEEIVDFDLQVCDTQSSIIGGALKEFVFSGRLDNLCSSFCSLKVLYEYSTRWLSFIKKFLVSYDTRVNQILFYCNMGITVQFVCYICLLCLARGHHNLCLEDDCGSFSILSGYLEIIIYPHVGAVGTDRFIIRFG